MFVVPVMVGMSPRTINLNSPPKQPSHCLWRLAWLFMLLVHAAPLAVRTFNSIGDASFESLLVSPLRTFILIPTFAFFILKIIDVRWLRFRTDFRATVSWLIIVSLLHLGALNRSINDHGGPSNGSLNIVLFVGGALAAATTICLVHIATARRPVRRVLNVAIQSPLFWCAIFRMWCAISRTCPRGPPAVSYRSAP